MGEKHHQRQWSRQQRNRSSFPFCLIVTQWAKIVVNIVGVVNIAIVVGDEGIVARGVDGAIAGGINRVSVRDEDSILVVVIDRAVVGSMDGVDRS